jgi:hypothetical protein
MSLNLEFYVEMKYDAKNMCGLFHFFKKMLVHVYDMCMKKSCAHEDTFPAIY